MPKACILNWKKAVYTEWRSTECKNVRKSTECKTVRKSTECKNVRKSTWMPFKSYIYVRRALNDNQS